MVRVSPPTVSAASGELSPLLFARRDFARFQNGARAVRGFVPLPEGPVTRLPGTRFMGFTKDNAPARLMSFVFRDEDAVLLVWSDLALRFWRQGAPVLSAGVPYEVASPYPAARLSSLQSLQSADRIYLVDGSLAPQTLSRFALTNWTLAPTAFVGGPFAPRNLDKALTITANDTTGEVTLTASAAVFGAHHVGTLFELRESDTSETPYWAPDKTLRVNDRALYGSNCYRVHSFDAPSGQSGTSQPGFREDEDGNVTSIRNDNQVRWTFVENGNPGGHANWAANTSYTRGDRRRHSGGNFTMEATSFSTLQDATERSSGVNPPVHSEGLWLSERSGIVWEYLHDGRGWVRITAVTSPTEAVGTVERRLPDGVVTNGTWRWAEAAWSAQRGWPRAIGAFEQRHVYGGTPTEPRALWFGVIGGTVDMTTGPNDDDGFSYALPSPRRQVGEILSITGTDEVLHVGTAADHVIGRATDADRAFARESARFDSVSPEGARAGIEPVVVAGEPLYIDKGGRRLLAMRIDQFGRYNAENLSQIARHILGPGVLRIVRQDRPVEVVWAVLADGRLAGVTYVPEAQVVGWHAHDLGGVVEDAEVMPSDDGLSQDLWLIVRRVLGGEQRRCIERMEAPFVDLDGAPRGLSDAWHQFCARRWTGDPATVLPGFTHLAGQVVTAWTEFGAFTGLVVAGDGTVTLPRAVTSAIVGLDATWAQRFDTLDIVSGQPDGGDGGRLRAHRATGVQLHRTAGGTLQHVGIRDAREQSLSEPKPLTPIEALTEPVLREGIVEVAGMKGWDHQQFLRFVPEPGAPLTILARTPTIMIGDA